MRTRLIVLSCALVAAVTACASVDSTADIQTARDQVAARVGVTPTWSNAELDSAPDATRAPWRGDALSASEAIAIALERNAELRRSVVAIESARAALAQTSTPPNPMLSLTLGFPVDGVGATTVTAAAMEQIAWLWQRPPLVDADEARLRASILSAADRASAIAAEVRRRHLDVVAAEESLVAARAAATAADEFRVAVQSQVAAGDAPSNALLEADGRAAFSRRARARAEGELRNARVRLLEAMGCSEVTVEWRTDGAWPTSTAPSESAAQCLSDALARRLDVAAADALVVAAEAECRAAGATRIPAVSLGAEYNQMMDTPTTLGPSGSVEVPIFDVGNARVATALAKLADARWAARAARQGAATETQFALAGLASANDRWQSGSEPMRRAAEARLRAVRASADAGVVPTRDVVEATAMLAERTMEAIDDRREAAGAAIALERSLAGGAP